MSKKDRFCAAYEHLRHIDKIRTQQDLADVIGSTSQNVSRALSGNPKVLTDNFLLRFLSAYPDIFSMSWLFNGTGSMLINDTDPVQQRRTYSIPEDTAVFASESSPLSERDLLVAIYSTVSRLADSFRDYQSRTDLRLHQLELLVAQLTNVSPFSQLNEVKTNKTIENQTNTNNKI